MQELQSKEGLVIRQQKEMLEAVTGIETKNRYQVFDTNGTELFLAAEEGGNTLLRWFLKALRPFLIVIQTLAGQTVLQVKRPFRFYFHQVEVSNAGGLILGTVQRRFSILSKKYSVQDSTGNEIYHLMGPFYRPWTFRIEQNGEEKGKIVKKWSGLLKEGFTDADNFGVAFPQDATAKARALLLGAVFLIDFVHFEDNSGSSSGISILGD